MQLDLDGFTASRANVFKAGDYIQINSYLYMVSADVSANGSGEANVYVEPSLRTGIEAINDDTTVVYSNTTTIMRLDSNELNWDTDKVSTYGISFACSEAIIMNFADLLKKNFIFISSSCFNSSWGILLLLSMF